MQLPPPSPLTRHPGTRVVGGENHEASASHIYVIPSILHEFVKAQLARDFWLYLFLTSEAWLVLFIPL